MCQDCTKHRQALFPQRSNNAERTTERSTYWHQVDNREILAHEPLDVSRREIRLLRIEANLSGELQCRLHHFELGHLPRFRCLSYMWGSDRQRSTIAVDGCGFQARENLYAFLELYKDRHLSEYIWIDSVCIDQSNAAERSSQVQLIGEIYSGADEVLI